MWFNCHDIILKKQKGIFEYEFLENENSFIIFLLSYQTHKTLVNPWNTK